jgi:hypothetical protein
MWWDSGRRRMFVCIHECRFQKKEKVDEKKEQKTGEGKE